MPSTPGILPIRVSAHLSAEWLTPEVFKVFPGISKVAASLFSGILDTASAANVIASSVAYKHCRTLCLQVSTLSL